MSDAIRWLIEHKQCGGFPQCWEVAPPGVRKAVVAAWGADPWPSSVRTPAEPTRTRQSAEVPDA